MPEQVAERPLAEAGLVIATHRVGTDFDEPSGCVIEGMSNLSVHRPSVAAPLEHDLHRVRYLSPARLTWRTLCGAAGLLETNSIAVPASGPAYGTPKARSAFTAKGQQSRATHDPRRPARDNAR